MTSDSSGSDSPPIVSSEVLGAEKAPSPSPPSPSQSGSEDENTPKAAPVSTVDEKWASLKVDPPGNKSVDPTIIDFEIFSQILDLDEGDDQREFSRSMTFAFFAQAVDTFKKMDEALERSDLEGLSSFGHFLKGSSAALGVWNLQSTCEKIQHYGQLHDSRGIVSAEDALEKIRLLLVQAKDEYEAAEAELQRWYNKEVPPPPKVAAL